MKERSEYSGSRRELFAAAGRSAALAVLAVGAAGLFTKRRRLVRQGKCDAGGTCAGCEMLARCDLPRALSAKEALIGGDNGGE